MIRSRATSLPVKKCFQRHIHDTACAAISVNLLRYVSEWPSPRRPPQLCRFGCAACPPTLAFGLHCPAIVNCYFSTSSIRLLAIHADAHLVSLVIFVHLRTDLTTEIVTKI